MNDANLSTLDLIDGAWVSAPSGATLAVTDPATDDVIAHVPDGGIEHAQAAIQALFPERGELGPEIRKRILAHPASIGRS